MRRTILVNLICVANNLKEVEFRDPLEKKSQ